MKQKQIPKIISSADLLEKLFTETLSNEDEFDPEVVELTKTHLGVTSPHSRAGNNLATALIALAKKRVSGGQQ